MMFGIGKKNINSSMTTIYLFLFILIINQFLIVRSFRLMSSELEQVLTFNNNLLFILIKTYQEYNRFRLKEKEETSDLCLM